MKVLVADKLPPEGIRAIEALGLTVTNSPDASADDLPGIVADHGILIVRSTKVSAATLDAGKSLQLVIRAGAGTNTIDVARASELGVFVANCPGKNAIAVAELAIGLLVAADRRIPQANADLRSGKWNKKEYGKAAGLCGRTLGVVGVGTIGAETIARARALGMRVMAWSRSLTDERAEALGAERAANLEALAEAADAVSVHLAHSAETKGLLGEAFVARLKPGAILVNTSRGGIVDEAALLPRVESGALRYAADVFADEPTSGACDTDHPIATHAAVIATPHIGASTAQAQEAVADEAVRIVTSFVRTGEVPNAVNLCAQSPATWMLSVRHLDRVGVLASVLGTIREAEINVQEMENIIFDGATAAIARIRLEAEPPADIVERLGSQEHVIEARLVAL